MKKRFQPLWLLSALAFVLSVGVALNGQQTTPQQGQSTDPQAQQPTAPARNGTTAPDQGTAEQNGPAAQSAQPNGVQAFSGTIVKEGDRYMLHDQATGQTYDLDHQDEVQKYAGKRVRVHGTLDPAGKMIHLQ
jgi:hypothetical protein